MSGFAPPKHIYTISKQFSFCASHKLDSLHADHPCGRVHGHNYIVEIELQSSTLNVAGFVVDYGELNVVKRWLNSTFDHRHLNDILTIQPSAENIARYIFKWCKQHFDQLAAVRVSETPKTWAEYRERQ